MKLLALLFFSFSILYSIEPHFKVVVLGSGGGPLESNISSYLVAPLNSNEFINIDSGNLLYGIEQAAKNGCFDDITLDPSSPYDLSGQIFRDHIKAHLLSHPHLDHVSALVLNSPLSTKRPIYGTDFTIDAVVQHLFNNIVWPNFGNEGSNPLNVFTYVRTPLEKKVEIPLPDMSLEAFALSHPADYESTAFLIESQGHFLLYFGDTSPDECEKEKHIEKIWQKIVPLIAQNRLHGIFIECSYPNSEPDNKLYGHMKPSFILQEFENLSKQVKINGLKVIITHVKELFQKETNAKEIIKNELLQSNLDVEFIFATQGTKLEL